jgi:hypothetical protein
VLTEDEYLERNDNPYSWPSVILHWALREFSILFVGCSMTDELVHRALRRSCKERAKDLEAERPKGRWKELDWRRQFAVVKLSSDDRTNKALNESLALLGVWPLWVKDYDKDLLQRIKKLRSWLRSERYCAEWR